MESFNKKLTLNSREPSSTVSTNIVSDVLVVAAAVLIVVVIVVAIINYVNKYSVTLPTGSKTFQVFGLSKALELIHDLHDNDDTSRQLLHDIEVSKNC